MLDEPNTLIFSHSFKIWLLISIPFGVMIKSEVER